jgi:DNA repair protein RadD
MFKMGAYQALVNCSILTTGFDHPATDAVVMLRPTLSPGLYVQMVGRGLRLHESKQDCLVLDFGGNVRRHGFIDQVTPPRKGKKGPPGEAPVKECNCGLLVPIMTRTCLECGHVFPAMERESETKHHIGAIISTEVPPVELKVDRVFYNRHLGKSGVPTLRVDYWCGLRKISEYVCLEHQGYARGKAVQWWRERCQDIDPPILVDQALRMQEQLAVPTHIVVNLAQKYPEIKRHKFEEITT